MYNFQKLEIYQLAKELCKNIYIITRQLPDIEKYALVQQLNRAAISVPSNIAEGVSRQTSKEKVRFINIAYGSLMEVVCQLEISVEIGYINPEEFKLVDKDMQVLARKMSNYIKAIEK